MSVPEPIRVGPNVQVPFFVMTDAGFPWGLRCAVCHRAITEGQPYESREEVVYDNGDVRGLITCVYCPLPDDDLRAALGDADGGEGRG